MDLEEQVKAIDKKVTSILHLLTGTDLDRSQGFLHQFEEERKENELLEQRVAKLERWKDRIVWSLVGMALPAGYGIVDILHTIFKTK